MTHANAGKPLVRSSPDTGLHRRPVRHSGGPGRAAWALAAVLPMACASGESRPVDPARTGLQAQPDTCGAAAFGHLIGEPRSAAPDPRERRDYRLASDRDPITEDFNPDRLNIFYDSRTGRIIGIRCF
ncbi:hypothetical protein [Sphingosinicella sp. CPCC 101087]|uniref:hypothetical protein n=1 Tax=Sphingosinicella sp. CPCC 101087 TaxID=2497754 RepID=UPI001981C2ED|nr:hypothetical protein [Sphingosinicella sp. CPCC 101087]